MAKKKKPVAQLSNTALIGALRDALKDAIAREREIKAETMDILRQITQVLSGHKS